MHSPSTAGNARLSIILTCMAALSHVAGTTANAGSAAIAPRGPITFQTTSNTTTAAPGATSNHRTNNGRMVARSSHRPLHGWGQTPTVYTHIPQLGYPCFAYPWPGGRLYIWATPRGACWRTHTAGASLIETARRLDPALLGESPQPQPPVTPQAEPIDIAILALQSARYDEAVEILRLRLFEDESSARLAATIDSAQQPAEDAPVPRTPQKIGEDRLLLVLALAGSGMIDGAQRELHSVRTDNPVLAMKPLNGRYLTRSSHELRAIVNRAVAAANRLQTPDAWKLVAFLMHAEGRHDLARQMAERPLARSTAPSTPVQHAPAPRNALPRSLSTTVDTGASSSDPNAGTHAQR